MRWFLSASGGERAACDHGSDTHEAPSPERHPISSVRKPRQSQNPRVSASRISVCGTQVASACDKCVNAQQSFAGSEPPEPTRPCTVNCWAVELSMDPPPTSSVLANLSIRCCPRCCPTRQPCCPHRACVVSCAAANSASPGAVGVAAQGKISGRLSSPPSLRSGTQSANR